jgi:hypothetical protein
VTSQNVERSRSSPLPDERRCEIGGVSFLARGSCGR